MMSKKKGNHRHTGKSAANGVDVEMGTLLIDYSKLTLKEATPGADGKFHTVILTDGLHDYNIYEDGLPNPELDGSTPSLRARMATVPWCNGLVLGAMVLVAIFVVLAAAYIIVAGGSLNTMVSRSQAFDVNLITETTRSVYAQLAQLELQRFELYQEQMLCLATVQCQRYNDAFFAHFGADLNCDYSIPTFEGLCPVPANAFTPFTYFGLNHTISGGDVRSVFNHASSSSNDFERELASLESRASPASIIPVHHGKHHKPPHVANGNSDAYNYYHYYSNIGSGKSND